MSARAWCVPAVLVWLGLLNAEQPAELPLALVLAAENARILRLGSELPLLARPGEVLFAGDSLRSEGGSVTFLSCRGNTRQTLSPDAEVLFEPGGTRLRQGRIADSKPSAGCFLPSLPRTVIASRQHAGAAIASEQVSQPGPVEVRPEELNSALIPIDAAIKAEPGDAVSRLARVQVLERFGLARDAAEEMREVARIWPDAGWARSRLFVLEEKAGKAATVKAREEPEIQGNTYALLVGVSSFQNARINPLRFAHEDARELTRLLESPRAGGVPDENVVMLLNERATRSAIQSAIESHLKARAGRNDTILLFIASHGASVNRKGYIVAYDSDPEDLATTGIPMDDIRALFETRLTQVKRLMLYVDVCHAGHIGQINPRPDETNKVAERAFTPEEAEMFGILAAQKNQVAIESVNYGGGHGAFSYFLMRALNGDADLNDDGVVTMPELYDHVHDRVAEATANRQIPKQLGDLDEKRVMAVRSRPGIELGDYTGPVNSAAARSLKGVPETPASPQSTPVVTSRALKYQDAATLIRQFENAVEEGRILPADDQGAFTYLQALRARLKIEDYRAEADKLRVALEDKGQQVLLTYLAGEAVPQNRNDFFTGQRYYEAAEQLAPNSVFLQSRTLFCRGRVAIFDKDYRSAAALLERAVGLDPERAYSYNALGISYLETADYERAILAFRDASRRAPYWAYPLHNMALAYSEKGDYDSAIRTYRRAMELAPHVAYLPYNLGLLYQRMDRGREAERLYRRTLAIDGTNAQALNSLGALNAEAGRRTEAERYYLEALKLDSSLLAARHNLALLVSADPKRSSEALALWRDNLARDPGHLPSRLSMAGYLARADRDVEAIREYEQVLAIRPEYVGARLALADLYMRMSKPADALAHLRQVLQAQPDNADVLEGAAKTYSALGNVEEAKAAYEKAFRLASDPSARKRIRAALRRTR